MVTKTRIILADDHDIVRAGVRTVLERLPDVEVVGEAQNGREALELARKLQPDVVLLDIAMPDLNGVEAARQMRAVVKGVRVVALSMHSDRQFVAEMLRAGATAYLVKNSVAQQLPLAIRAVRAGKVFLSPEVADVVVEGFVRNTPVRGGVFESLSSREREVLQLLAEGKSNKEIAGKLSISPKTVESHRAQITSKLKLNSVAELTKLAIREGLTSLE